jgi:hypothetical protein
VSEFNLRIISLGAGVQSTTLALMAAHGEVGPMPDCAIFADTKAEPAAVYRHLDWLETVLPFPVHRVVQGAGLTADVIAGANDETFASLPPFFTLTADGGGKGLLRRGCTQEFKIAPIRRKVRELLGAPRTGRVPAGLRVEQWIGISLDEAQRMKPSRDSWSVHRWPLIDLRMSRGDCLQWMERHGYPRPPRSACTFCPYHNDAEWRAIKNGPPDEWAGVVALDRLIRGGVKGTRDRLFLHRSCVPIDKVDLATAEDHGQLSISFGNECEGMCGV